MRIGINATFRLHGGGKLHLQQLLRAWVRTKADEKHEICLITRRSNVPQLQPFLSRRVTVELVPEFSQFARLLWEQASLPGLARDLGLDVLFCPANTSPLVCSVPTVVAMRNAAPFCESITRRSVGLRDWLRFRQLGLAMKLSARTATRVVFISNWLRQRFIANFGIGTDRSDVIYHGRDSWTNPDCRSPAVEPAARIARERPYLLCVSHLYSYHQIPTLIRGVSLCKPAFARAGLQLIITGAGERDDLKRLESEVRTLGISELISFAGFVPHEGLPALIRGCFGFVFQSTCENCPNTLIEGLAAGVPICCSETGVMPEIAGDGAIYYDPLDPHDIARVLTTIIEDSGLRDSLRVKALRETDRFSSWETVSDMYLESFRRACADTPARK